MDFKAIIGYWWRNKLMYPRNAASPEPVAIGAVVQISDGAVQTSGCTVRIKPIGVAEGDGGGTTAYSTDGIVLYTPTQAETNYTSFVLIAKKTGCIPACVTVVTTASSVPGRTMPADGSITAAVIATDAIDADAIKADAVTEIQAGLATPTNITAATGITLAAVTHTGAVIPTVTTVTNGLDAAGVRTAIGLTVANLDTQLADLPTVAEFEARSLPAADYFVVGDYTAPPSASTISSQVAADLAVAHGVGAWTTATGFSTLSQADIRTAVGLTTANLDTQIGNIQSDTNDIQTRLPAALESGRIAAALDSAARVKLDGTQPDYAPLLASGYIAPANSDITAIKVKTDNLPSDPADQSLVIAATDAVMGRLGAPAGASMSADIAAVKTDTGNLVSRITANLFSGITYLSRWLGALAGKTADTTTRTEINATTAGAGYNETTDSLEAQKDSGGGGGGDATLAKQEEILTRLTEVSISVTGYAQLDIYGVLQLKRGHTATLTFTSDTNNVVSDLSAATTKVFFGIKDAAGRSWLSIEGTKLVNTGLQSVRFTISAALAAAMINGEHFFDVVAVYDYNANTTPKYTSLQPFTSGRAKVTDLYVDI
jgi:hypothetical protein